jgi:hypothetical protein
VCVDLERRPAFEEYLKGWKARGFALEGGNYSDPLGNIQYIEGDLNGVLSSVGADSCVVALHACNEANRDVVEGAKASGALWAVMPCCIRQKLYLPECSVELPDETRYLMLAGSFANEYQAQLVRSIDPLITARPVLIGGGLERPTCESTNEASAPPGSFTMPLPPKPKRIRGGNRHVGGARVMPP